jgi:hypothetical protein
VLQSLAPNGHALLWHNQCPDWFFNDEGRDAGRGNWCFNACEPTYNRRWMVERTIGWLPALPPALHPVGAVDHDVSGLSSFGLLKQVLG